MILALLACSPVGNVQATVSTVIPTAVTVTWETNAADSWVEYGLDESLGWVARPTGDTLSAVLIGMPPNTDVYYRVVTKEDTSVAPDVVTTGGLSPDLPVLTVEGTNDRFLFSTVLGSNTGPLILDPQGRIVWFYDEPRELDVYRARISRDHRYVIYNAASVSGDPADNSSIVKVALDGSEVIDIPVPLLAHDWVELPDGTITAMVTEYRDFEGTELRGDQLVEIAPDGTQTVVWSGWDCFDPAVHVGTDQEAGWTFGNALDYEAFNDSYYMSFRNFSSIFQIDRATGTCPWVLGDTGATMDFADGSDEFLHEHQFQLLDQGAGLVVFDNEGAPGTESRVIEYDLTGGVATEVWSYYADPSVFTFVLGEPMRLDDGDTIVDWATGGQIDRVDPEGNVEFRVNTTMGFAFGFMSESRTPYPE